jgi:hypothetical protein
MKPFTLELFIVLPCISFNIVTSKNVSNGNLWAIGDVQFYIVVRFILCYCLSDYFVLRKPIKFDLDFYKVWVN